MKIKLLLVQLMFLCGGAKAQSLWMLDPDEKGYTVAAGFEFTQASSAFTTRFVNSFYSGKYLDEELKDKVAGRLKGYNRFGADLNYGFSFQFMPDSTKNQHWGYFGSYKRRINANLSFTEDLYRTYFYGNAPFAGKNALLGKSDFNFTSWSQFQVGAVKKFDGKAHAVFGGALSLLMGANNLKIHVEKGNLFTQEEGLYLDLDVDMYMRNSGTGSNSKGFKGTGAGADLFVAFGEDDIGKFKFEVRDLGFISWRSQSKYFRSDTAFRFDGYDVSNIFSLGDTLVRFSSDSITDVYGKQKTEKYTSVLPFYLHGAFQRNVKGNLLMSIGMMYRVNAHYFPLIYTEGLLTLKHGLRFSSRLSFGGYGLFNVGFAVKKQFYRRYDIQLGTNNLEGFVVPGISSGQGLWVGLRATF